MELTEKPDNATKDRILNGASQLFIRRGIKGVSMDDIATALGISKKTLYKWYETKDQLVLAAVQEHMGSSQRDCVQMEQQAENAVHENVMMMKWTKHEFSDVHPGVFFEMKKYYPAAYAHWQVHKLSFILGQIERNLRRGMAEGLYRDDLDVEVLSRLHLAQIEGGMDPDLFPARQFQLQRVSQVADEHFLRGIVTPAGLDLMNRYLRLP